MDALGSGGRSPAYEEADAAQAVVAPASAGGLGPAPEPAAAASAGAGRRSRLRGPLMLAGIVALLAGLFLYLHGGGRESTDNAYLQTGLAGIAANVTGQVVAVEVRDNQRVRAGQVLFRIDSAPYRAAVDEAEAALADARAQTTALQASYAQGAADLGSAQDQLAYARREAARQRALLAEGISSQSQYDQAALAAQTAAQAIESGRQKNAGVAATLSGRVTGPIEAQPAVRRAQAALDRARLNLSYTVVRARQDGIVTKVDQLQPGDFVAAGRPVFTLAGARVWVEANFKESQLAHMRVGQPVRIKVDAFPDLKLTGRVASFSPGTGNSFALLPAENATGNWVKVVQRLPVEVDIDRLPTDAPLHAGLSVEVTVDTSAAAG